VASFWLEEPPEPLPQRTLPGDPDVEIVGGGVTGCSCALALATAGLRVRLHEAREIAGGASGRNGGFALRGAALAYNQAREQLGPTWARRYWDLTERALARMAELAGDAFRHVGSLRLAVDDAEAADVRAEYDALTSDGYSAEWLDRDELSPALRGRFAAALFHPPDGALQPARWVRRLARRAVEAGAELREHSSVSSVGELSASHVVLATDGYTRGLVPELDARIRPTRGQVIVTHPLPDLVFERPHYARHGLEYWQQTPDRRLVLGGWRDAALDDELTAEETITPVVQERLEEAVSDLLGELPPITHRWAGIWGTTADLMPLVGPLPENERVWVSVGYSGHGNVLGFACGELVGRALAGDAAPILDGFSPARESA
jgi:gamma-glutamylputrescine oxidase